MRTVERWYWRVPSIRPGKTHVTRWKMTEAEALAQWPTAEKAYGHEVIELPETDEELAALSLSRFGGMAPGMDKL